MTEHFPASTTATCNRPDGMSRPGAFNVEPGRILDLGRGRVALGVAVLWLGLIGNGGIAQSGASSTSSQTDTAEVRSSGTLAAARAQLASGDFRGAAATLRAEVGKEDRSAEAHSLLGYTLLRLNEPKESLAEYTRTAQLRTPSAEELRNVANDYALLDDFNDADRWMNRSLQMNDRDPETWYDLGRIRYTLQRFEEAANCFQKALVLEPKSVKAADNLALAYEGLNRNAEAIEEYRLALEWQKDSLHPSEQPMLNLATLMIFDGQEKGALPLLQHAVAIAPKNPKIHEQLGHVYLHLEELPAAQREFETAVALSPDHAAYHFLLGQAYRRQGEKEKAKVEFDRAAALDGTHSAEH